MMRSMFSGVSALRNHQTQMDVIGNNIANVNTVGFKAGRVNFREVFAQTLQAASAPAADGSRGGTNPMQVGLGMSISSIDTLHLEGNVQTTGNMTDLAINGSGFFVVNDGTRDYYTRAGLFDVDEQGFLTMKGNGYRVQGWQKQGDTINTDAEPGNIRIPFGDTIPAQATTELQLGGNLNPDAGEPITVLGTVRDSLGRSHQVYIHLEKRSASDDDGNTVWTWTTDSPFAGWGKVTFDTSGRFVRADDGSDGAPVLSNNAIPGADRLSITLDMSQLTQYVQETTAEPIGHNGRAAGTLETFDIDSAGILRGVFSNGLMEELAQVSVAMFNNPGGLSKAGDTLFQVTANSGEARIGPPSSGGRGAIAPSSLEMSNVDLSQEFTNMIVSQRGFQANSRVITTSDEMLQELVNLKR